MKDLVKFSEEEVFSDEPKCLFVLLIDTSLSMEHALRMIKEELINLKKTIGNNEVAVERAELCIVEFNSHSKVLSSPRNLEDFEIPEKFNAKGLTDMAAGITKSIQVVEIRKQTYKDTEQPYFRPFIIMITDGCPTTPISEISKVIESDVDKNKYVFIPFGIASADMNKLEELSHKNYPPRKIERYQFEEIFKWLSNSMKVVSSTDIRNTDVYEEQYLDAPGHPHQKEID